MKRNLRGMIVPLVTPFASEDVDIASIRSNVTNYARTRLAGLFVGGSNGESKSLTDQEKLAVLAAVLESRAEHQAVIAGTGHESTRQTVALSKQAEQLGADYVCVLTPSYFKKRLTDEALIGYYNNIADALTIPVLIYNAPGFTGVTISPKVVGVVSRHPNIVGIKDSAPGDGGPYLEVVDSSFLVFSGTINQLYPALILGAAGGVVSLANAFPDACCDLFERAQSGDLESARRLHFKLTRLNHSISGKYGVAGVKYAMDQAGYRGGDPRLPLMPLSEEEMRSIAAAIQEAALLP